MGDLATTYSVHFIAEADDFKWEARFTASNPEDVKNIVSAMSAYCSGDPCRCFINGEEAVLESDWGLMLESHHTDTIKEGR